MTPEDVDPLNGPENRGCDIITTSRNDLIMTSLESTGGYIRPYRRHSQPTAYTTIRTRTLDQYL
jgi:hypothetical protein